MSVTSDRSNKDTVNVDIIEFLQEYEKLPCLWDKEHVYFKDRSIRADAEEVLAEKFGFRDLYSLRKKIRSIRGSYNTEVRKIRTSLENGYEVYVPTLSWFDTADKFLRVTTDIPHELTMIEKLDTDSEDNELKSEQLTIDETQEDYILDDEETDHDAFNKMPKRKRLGATFKRKPLKSDNMLRTLKDIYNQSDNEFMAFGNSVGLQLKNMPLELALQLQSDIQTHITNTRLEYLRKNKNIIEE